MIGPALGMSKTDVQTMINDAMAGNDDVYQMDATPTNGQTVSIPDSNARVINLLIWPATDIATLNIMLPPTKPGRRVFLYSDKAIGQVTVSTTQSGVLVRNGVLSMNAFDQTVFNTANNTIWARVISS